MSPKTLFLNECVFWVEMTFLEDNLQSIMVLTQIFLSFFHCVFSWCVYHTKWICFLLQIVLCSLEFLGLTVGWSLVYFVITLWTPLLQDPFSWQDPDICVGSFTKVSPKNNRTCFCSGPSTPITCLAPIVLISPVCRATGPEGLRTLGPKSTSEDLKFLFLLWRQKKTSRGGKYQPWPFLFLKGLVFLVNPCSEAADHVILALGKCLSSNSSPCATPKSHSWPKRTNRLASRYLCSILPSPSSLLQTSRGHISSATEDSGETWANQLILKVLSLFFSSLKTWLLITPSRKASRTSPAPCLIAPRLIVFCLCPSVKQPVVDRSSQVPGSYLGQTDEVGRKGGVAGAADRAQCGWTWTPET